LKGEGRDFGIVRAKITALGTYVPPRILTNQDLEKMVDTTDQWILERTGIRERHLVDKGVAASDLAVEAVKNLQESHPIDLQEIDLIVVGTVTPDMMYPSTACLVQHKLGIHRTWGFDVSAGCSGFLYALNTGAEFVSSGRYKKVLVIGSDVNSSMTDFTDRAVCIIFGDGAGAVLLEPAAEGEDSESSICRPRSKAWVGSLSTCLAAEVCILRRMRRSIRRCTTSTRTASRSLSTR
jgi:3-oxoacyl-[acyl-carrier-protein] synthase III